MLLVGSNVTLHRGLVMLGPASFPESLNNDQLHFMHTEAPLSTFNWYARLPLDSGEFLWTDLSV